MVIHTTDDVAQALRCERGLPRPGPRDVEPGLPGIRAVLAPPGLCEHLCSVLGLASERSPGPPFLWPPGGVQLVRGLSPGPANLRTYGQSACAQGRGGDSWRDTWNDASPPELGGLAAELAGADAQHILSAGKSGSRSPCCILPDPREAL